MSVRSGPPAWPQDEASPLVRIRSLLPGLARAEQRVAQVVLADPSSVARCSITEVADRAGTSETTVTRFCKAIGVGGYPELRLSLAADTARTAARNGREVSCDIRPDDGIAAVVAAVAFADARAVEDTAEQLDVGALRGAVDALARARRVEVYGVGASTVVAQYLQQKLHRIGRACHAWADPHTALASAALLGTDDVAVGISHTGSSSDVVDALAQARRSGAVTVAVTNFPRSPICELADHVLTTAVREMTFRSGSTASRVAQLTVVDCLFTGVAQQHDATARRALAAGDDAVDGRRLVARHDGRRTPRPVEP